MSKTTSKISLPKPSNTLYLIDISSFIFRAFYAIRSLQSKSGEPTNAVYGVATMLARLAEEAHPEYLAVVYDSKEPSFRKELYTEYKANRTSPPDDLIPQFGRIEEMIRAFEIHSYRQSGVEADDLIATLTHRWCKESEKNQVIIVSSDKDLMQLVNDRVQIWDTMTNKLYGVDQVVEKFGVGPHQIRDYLALVGDSSDNIPGVKGIGPKGAVDLLKEFGSLSHVLKAAHEGEVAGKKGETLKTHEKDARLSAELATVKDDLSVDIPLESLSYKFHVTKKLSELFHELSFQSLLARWSAQKGTESALISSDQEAGSALNQIALSHENRFKTILSREDLCSVIESIRKVGEFGFDLETTSLNPREAQIVGIALCYDSESSYYIPVGHRVAQVTQLSLKEVFQELKPVLEDPKIKKIGQNLKYDWSVLIEHGVKPQGIGADTMVAAYLLDPDDRHNLQVLASRYLDYSMLTYEQVCGKGKDAIGFDLVSIELATRYSAEDAWVALLLWRKLKPLLEEQALLPVFHEIDLPLVEVLTRMELQGVCIDVEWLNRLSSDFERELRSIEEKIHAHAQRPLNLNSPKQLAQLLFEDLKLPPQGKTKTGYSTDAQVLDALAPLHEVPRLLLEYREISKLKGTYVDPLPGLRDTKTQKIHPSFHQTVAATGRLSCSDPNLQNIPTRTERGRSIRGAFIPSPGHMLLSADYSQIELRLLAQMSGDPELIRAFKNDEDVHRQTACEIFGVAPEQVNDHERSVAKAINFGLMYGKTAFGLSQELKIPRRQAQEMIDRYFTRYHAVKTFLDSQIEKARQNGFVTSLLGRKRALSEIHSKNAMLRANAERMAMNTPIQATAADLMKLAMTEIDRRLISEGFRSRLIIQVHDEVLLDCPVDELDRVKGLVVQVMENAMPKRLEFTVPLKVNSSSGRNWMEL